MSFFLRGLPKVPCSMAYFVSSCLSECVRIYFSTTSLCLNDLKNEDNPNNEDDLKTVREVVVVKKF